MEKCGRQKVSIRFFPHYETQKRKVLQDFSSRENIPTPKRSQESDSKWKGIKEHVAHDLVKMEFSSNRFRTLQAVTN